MIKERKITDIFSMEIIPDLIEDKSLKKIIQFDGNKAHVSKYLHFYLRTLPTDEWERFFEKHGITFIVIN